MGVKFPEKRYVTLEWHLTGSSDTIFGIGNTGTSEGRCYIISPFTTPDKFDQSNQIYTSDILIILVSMTRLQTGSDAHASQFVLNIKLIRIQ